MAQGDGMPRQESIFLYSASGGGSDLGSVQGPLAGLGGPRERRRCPQTRCRGRLWGRPKLVGSHGICEFPQTM